MAKSLILTLSKNGAIGAGEESTTEWTTKEDLRWFIAVTKKAGTVVMGRKTFETMKSKPLKDRMNYILTRDPSKIEKQENLIPITLEDFYTLNLKDYCVIGGGEIFKEFMNKVEVLYISTHKNVEVDAPKFDIDLSSCVLFDKGESDEVIEEIWIRNPYKSSKIEVTYEDSPFMDEAFEVEKEQSLDKGFPVGVVYVKDGKVVARGANGSTYHDEHGCERKRLGIPTGQGYELCEGCHPKNHGEAKAVKIAKDNHTYENLKGATAYMHGHYWACESCNQKMEEAGIIKLVMSKSWAKEYFKIADLYFLKDDEK
jgi:dihydrofolate reductase